MILYEKSSNTADLIDNEVGTAGETSKDCLAQYFPIAAQTLIGCLCSIPVINPPARLKKDILIFVDTKILKTREK